MEFQFFIGAQKDPIIVNKVKLLVYIRLQPLPCIFSSGVNDQIILPFLSLCSISALLFNNSLTMSRLPAAAAIVNGVSLLLSVCALTSTVVLPPIAMVGTPLFKARST